jgi:transposase-like protein
MKPWEREESRRLRQEDGLSVKEIARHLGVSKSSVSLWVRDIQLTDEQLATLEYRHHNHANQRNGSRAVAEKYRALRRKYQEEGRQKARDRDPLHIAGCMLYWGEGSKTKNLELANSDPDLVQFYMKFLRESLDIRNSEINIRIYCYTNNGLSVSEIEDFWLNSLTLSQKSLRKAVTNLRPRSSEQKGRILKYGMCRVAVHRVSALHHVLGAIQEYTGIDKPEWLG